MSARPAPTSRAGLEVLAPGTLSLVQDAGRPGLGDLGVGPSGAADRGAFELGARLLGQDGSFAAVESLGGGLVLRARGSLTAVVTGAPAPTRVDGVPVGHAAPFLVGDGAELWLGRPPTGLRTYVSVRGGIAVPPVLGSRSRDTLSGLGPEPLVAGQLLRVGDPRGDLLVDVAPVARPSGGLVLLEAFQGPRWDWLAEPDALEHGPWLVGVDSDRVGVRLEGPGLARHPAHDRAELPSEGVVRGAVQLPPGGRPVIFLADHPVTGGYPVVAVLTAAACDLAAQLVPGQPVRLRMASAPGRP